MGYYKINVAWLYESGELSEPDLQTAIKWYKKGAIRKEEHAIEALERLNVPLENKKTTVLKQ